jgi:hypothetical protein
MSHFDGNRLSDRIKMGKHGQLLEESLFLRLC